MLGSFHQCKVTARTTEAKTTSKTISQTHQYGIAGYFHIFDSSLMILSPRIPPIVFVETANFLVQKGSRLPVN